jgi:alpha-galactosidase
VTASAAFPVETVPSPSTLRAEESDIVDEIVMTARLEPSDPTADEREAEAQATRMSVADVRWSTERPISLASLSGSTMLGREDVPLVEVFTSREQRARSSQAYVRSAVGARLRVRRIVEDAAAGADRLVIEQHDAASGLTVTTTLTRPSGLSAVRIETIVHNTSNEPVTLTALTTSFGIRRTEKLDGITLGVAASEWLAENRWREVPLTDVMPTLDLALHEQDGRGHFGITSRGGWSSGEHLPTGFLVDDDSGEAAAWQIETSAG